MTMRVGCALLITLKDSVRSVTVLRRAASLVTCGGSLTPPSSASLRKDWSTTTLSETRANERNDQHPTENLIDPGPDPRKDRASKEVRGVLKDIPPIRKK